MYCVLGFTECTDPWAKNRLVKQGREAGLVLISTDAMRVRIPSTQQSISLNEYMDSSKILRYASAFFAIAKFTSDHMDLFKTFKDNGVRYVVIGGEAMERCKTRNSCGDKDILVDKSPENSRRIYKALVEFGYPVHILGITPDTFSDVGEPAMNAVLPGNVEIISSIKEIPISFEQAFRFSEEENGIHWLSPQGLANLKGHKDISERRERDLIDLELLKKHHGVTPQEIDEILGQTG